MRYPLTILPNGLITVKIRLANSAKNLEVVCDALIDTGAEMSLICTSIYNELSITAEETGKFGASTLDSDEMVPVCQVTLFFPEKEWSPNLTSMFVKDFSKRDEYQAIIGMDILKDHQLVYRGLQQEAWIDLT
jgi:hypothetical protein